MNYTGAIPHHIPTQIVMVADAVRGNPNARAAIMALPESAWMRESLQGRDALVDAGLPADVAARIRPRAPMPGGLSPLGSLRCPDCTYLAVDADDLREHVALNRRTHP